MKLAIPVKVLAVRDLCGGTHCVLCLRIEAGERCDHGSDTSSLGSGATRGNCPGDVLLFRLDVK